MVNKKISELPKIETLNDKINLLAADLNTLGSYRSGRVEFSNIKTSIHNYTYGQATNYTDTKTTELNTTIQVSLSELRQSINAADTQIVDIKTNLFPTVHTKILTLSDSISSDIESLSNNLSGDIQKLSDDISADILALSTALSNEIIALNETAKISIDNLSSTTEGICIALSTDIGTVLLSVDGISSIITNSLSTFAAANNPGLVKLGFTTNNENRDYAVNIKNGDAYVHVPWTGEGGGGSEPADYSQVRQNVETLSSKLKFTYLDNDGNERPQNLVNVNTENINNISGSIDLLCAYLSDIYLTEDPESHVITILEPNKVKLHDLNITDLADVSSLVTSPFGTVSSTVDILNELSNRLDTTVPSIDSFFNTIYPVGSIYISYEKELPATFTGHGIWIRLTTGKCLWSSEQDGSNVTKEINAGIPKPTVQLKNVKCSEIKTGITATTTANNVTTTEYQLAEGDTSVVAVQDVNDSSVNIVESSHKHDMTAEIEFIDSGSVYGNSTTVQPPAIVVSMWRRVG